MKRRNFIKSSAVFAAPTIVPSYVLGQGDKVAPSNRITLGLIGCGGQGNGDMRNIMNSAEIQTVAVCDPDKGRREGAKNGVEKRYAEDKASGTFKGCNAYNDFREITESKDVDAVIVGTPDHWHAIATLSALRNGKDVYCEKPITHLFAEGQAVYKESAKQKAIFQVGSQQRSDTRFRIAAEIVMNGLIGKVKEVQVGLPTGRSTDIDGKTAQPIPDGLDYDLWCGRAACCRSTQSVSTGTGAGAWTTVAASSWIGSAITMTSPTGGSAWTRAARSRWRRKVSATR